MQKLFTPAQAGEVLGLTADTVRGYCQSGELVASKFGHMWLIRHADLVRFERKERRPGNPNFRRSG